MVKISGLGGTIRDDESGRPLVNQSQQSTSSSSTPTTNEPFTFTLRGETQLFGFKVPNWSIILALVVSFLSLGRQGLGMFTTTISHSIPSQICLISPTIFFLLCFF